MASVAIRQRASGTPEGNHGSRSVSCMSNRSDKLSEAASTTLQRVSWAMKSSARTVSQLSLLSFRHRPNLYVDGSLSFPEWSRHQSPTRLDLCLGASYSAF